MEDKIYTYGFAIVCFGVYMYHQRVVKQKPWKEILSVMGKYFIILIVILTVLNFILPKK